MHNGLMVSAGAHAAVLAAAVLVLATPASLKNPGTRSIAVDIVTPNEIGLPPKGPDQPQSQAASAPATPSASTPTTPTGDHAGRTSRRSSAARPS